jgi:hypothetical protein
MHKKTFKKMVHFLLIILVVLVIISGLGIIYYQIIDLVTMSILTKDLAFKIHTLIFIPFLIVLLLHSAMSWILDEKLINS